MDADGPVHEVDPAWVDDPDRRLGYGPAKVLSEMELRNEFPEDFVVVRPGLIVGPGDDETINEDTGVQTVRAWASGFSSLSAAPQASA